ncbi:MAG TPA: IS1595 family transposase [Phycisphaerales bacterium]|nr:IS1595 family transposase [Phycisphaerales bacterium]
MARNQGKVGENKSETIRELPVACMDEASAVAFMEKQRWGASPCCPECGDTNVYQMTGRDGNRNKDYRWRCRGCGKLYTVRTGTVMEDSRVPLRHWCYAFWRACTSKKGVSALEIQRQTGLSYKSALFLMHRIRFAMAPTSNGPKLTGTVEADETYIGGKPRHRTPHTFYDGSGRKSNHQTVKDRKVRVFAAVQRNGQARVRVLPTVNGMNLPDAVREHIDLSSRLMTDELRAYRKVGPDFTGGHHIVNHSKYEYVRGDVTTNTVESFFALLKRGIIGIYHNVSRKHLQRYLDEAEFRYNHRKLEDGDRVIAAIRGGDGRRLAYREPTGST